MFNKDYVNCIIINSLTDVDETAEASDLSDEDLFLSREEHGIYSRYVNISKSVKSVEDNSCFVKLIVKRFQKAFEQAYDQKSKSYKFELTTKSLCDLCGIEYRNDNIGLSVNKSLAFFKKFHLGLHVFGPFGTIFKYKPEKRNRHLNPSSLFIFILNNHCYEINENVKEFERLHWENPLTIISKMK